MVSGTAIKFTFSMQVHERSTTTALQKECLKSAKILSKLMKFSLKTVYLGLIDALNRISTTTAP
jgi:hypothetical protein